MGVLLGLAAAVFFGTADMFARGAAQRVGTFRTLLYMQTVGFVALGGYLVLSGEAARLIAATTWDAWTWAVIVAVMNMLSSLALYRSFEVCKAMALVSPIAASYAAITVVLAVLSGEVLSPQRGVGVVFTIIGVVLAAAHLESRPSLSRTMFSRSIFADGVGWALLASLGYGFTFFLLGFHVTPAIGGIAPVWVVRLTTLVLLPIIGLIARWDVTPPRGNVWWFIIAVGVLDTSAFVANAVGLTTDQVSVVTVLASLFSAVTVILSWLFLHERLARSQWLGVLLIFVGIVLVSI